MDNDISSAISDARPLKYSFFDGLILKVSTKSNIDLQIGVGDGGGYVSGHTSRLTLVLRPLVRGAPLRSLTIRLILAHEILRIKLFGEQDMA